MRKNRYSLHRPRRFRLRPFALILAALLLTALVFPRFFSDTETPPASSAATASATSEEYPAGPLPQDLTFDKLVLEKAAHRLTAFHDGKPLRIYRVALGFVPVGHKQFQGDGKTPEGAYTINDKNPNSAYYKNLGVSYPNAADRAFAQKNKKNPGGDIKIHGLAPHFASLGAAHRLIDWTYGCIAVTNPEMEELYAHTAVGAPIEILP